MGQTVLVPVDDSPQSEAAFEHAREKLPESRLILVHVINPMGSLAFADDEYFDAEVYRSEQRKRRERAENLLEEYAQKARDQGLEVETVVRVGKPAREILEVAEDRDIDHIVMGSHGRSGVGRVVFGSVAETVTRRSPTPVTIVR